MIGKDNIKTPSIRFAKRVKINFTPTSKATIIANIINAFLNTGFTRSLLCL